MVTKSSTQVSEVLQRHDAVIPKGKLEATISTMNDKREGS